MRKILNGESEGRIQSLAIFKTQTQHFPANTGEKSLKPLVVRKSRPR